MSVEASLDGLAMIGTSGIDGGTHGVGAGGVALDSESLAHVGAFAALGLEARSESDRSAGRGEPAHLARGGLAEEGADSLGLTEGLHGSGQIAVSQLEGSRTECRVCL